MITREVIEQRISTLMAEREQAVAQVNAYVGAIQDAQWFLEQLEAGVSSEAPATPIEGDAYDDNSDLISR